ncbi:MAG: ATP-dependent RecD-like DNA helicase [Opitutales bacterium]|jgi:exodeoxyribonuclease V alpha subunit
MSSSPDADPIAPGQGDAVDQIDGVVDRIVFSNAENGYVIAEIKQEREGLVTVKGVLPGLRCGESVSVRGRRVMHPNFGPQMEAESFSVRLPASVEALRKFLGSGLVPGVGKGFADKIVSRFGMDTMRILNEESARLREVPGLGAGRAAKIKTAWDEQLALREVLMFLQSYGVGVRRCMRIVKEYGAAAPVLLREDPYALARDVDGIGFRTADKIALNMGIGNDSERRIDAGLVYVLGEAEAEGHSALPQDELAERCARLLRCAQDRAEVRVGEMLARRELCIYEGLVQTPGPARAEERIAAELKRILRTASALPPIRIDAAIDWAERRAGFAFAPEQADAVAAALSEKLCVITGGPGTGKTSILRAVVDILSAKKARVLLASPTGRAAQRLAASAGMPAATLHRLLRFNENQDASEQKPLEADMVIVDEASMLDVRLCSALVRGIGQGTHLLLVGDSDQLPSVGPGNVLADIIDSGLAAVVRLKSVFRQSEGSRIVAAANGILMGDTAPPPPVDLRTLTEGTIPELSMYVTDSPEDVVRAVISISRRWKDEGVDPLDMQVMAPMHKGRAGILAFNLALQKALNGESRLCLEDASGQAFRAGDKVICTRNNYDKSVFNGDMGVISHVDPKENTLVVSFAEGDISFSRMEMVDLMPAYAISIHKSQGSEFDHVIIPLMPEHLVLLRRNLLYTALTRARLTAVIVGSTAAWRMALAKARSGDRCTTLCRRLLA